MFILEFFLVLLATFIFFRILRQVHQQRNILANPDWILARSDKVGIRSFP